MIVWHTKQALALARREEFSKTAVRVFCAESHHQAVQKFLTCLLDQFVHWYYRLEPILRHLYEVIPEDSRCRLYFDVEYKVALNPDVEERDVLQTLKSVIINAVAKLIGLQISNEDIVDLVTKTDAKMSHHLIVHLPGAVFENNLVCGHFVRLLHHETREYVDNGQSGKL